MFEDAAANIADCARRLQDLVTDFTDASAKLTRIMESEQHGDEITRSILLRLNSSFVTPFDREDIHALTEHLDDIVDDVLAIGDLMVLHNVGEPMPEIREMARTLVEAAEANEALVRTLPNFKGMQEHLDAIDRLESSADAAYRRAVARLFSGDYEAFEVLRWKDIVEALEAAVNAIERVSDTVESIALKHS
jgi:predicted phosphate transport protein (TIGR00153 family)